MKGNGFLKLCIAGHNLNFEEITEKLGQKPSFVCREHDSYTPKHGEPITYKEDCWVLETEKKEHETLDGAIAGFVSKFKDSADYLKELSEKCDVTLWISLYPDEEQSNIHLSPETLKLMADMGIQVDFNIMFLKEFYDGTYNE